MCSQRSGRPVVAATELLSWIVEELSLVLTSILFVQHPDSGATCAHRKVNFMYPQMYLSSHANEHCQIPHLEKKNIFLKRTFKSMTKP